MQIEEAPQKESPRKWIEDKDADEDESDETYGAYRATTANENATSFYIVPMKGQMGTDVNTDLYEEMVDDIRLHKPDYLIIEIDTTIKEKDLWERDLSRAEIGLNIIDEYRDLVNLFQDDLSDIRQVVWIKESRGISSVVAMSWKDMYMMTGAEFGGLSGLQQLFMVADPDVRGKFREAFMAMIKGLTIYGGYASELIDGMVRMEMSLSADWKGREVEWRLDKSGEYLVDGSENKTADFTAKVAEDLCISDGTAENLDDLALLMGIREYRVLDSKGEQIFEKYIENWRRTLENCRQWWDDYNKYMSWASGGETLQYLGRAKATLEKIIAAIRRYKAVEYRVAIELGLNEFILTTTVEVLEEQIRALRQSGRGGGGGGGAGRGRGGGGGGPGPGRG